jgi:hypothetical protein
VSRRSFYAGTAAVAVGVAAVTSGCLTALQAIERATDGWGMRLNFFRVPYLLSGPWYLTWLSSFAGLTLAIAWGMWFGIVFRRWGAAGLLAFLTFQAAVATAVVLVISLADGWKSTGIFFTTLTIEGLTGILAVVALAFLACGFATTRRAAA